MLNTIKTFFGGGPDASVPRAAEPQAKPPSKIASLVQGVFASAPPPDGRRAFGLSNNGNTCYVNSAMQFLFSIDLFRSQLFQESFDEKKQPIGFSLQKLFEGMTLQVVNKTTLKDELLRVHQAVVNIKFFGAKFKVGNAECSGDFLGVLLTGLENELDERDGIQKFIRPENLNIKDSVIGSQQYMEARAASVNRFIFDIFYFGHAKSTTCNPCKDRFFGFGINNILDLSLFVPQETGPVRIERLFENAHRGRAVDFLAPCRRCRCNEKKGTVQTSVVKYPPVLMVFLKRHQQNQRGEMVKDNRIVEFREALLLPKHPLDPDNKETDEYRLRSFILHEGSLVAGHYTAVSRVAGQWNKFDDTQVTPLPKDFKQGDYEKNVFFLSYERVSGKVVEQLASARASEDN